MNCPYLIKLRDPRVKIILDFKFFDVEGGANCTYASVKIYDGHSTSANQLGPSQGYCGKIKQQNLTSSGNSLLIVYKSDGRITPYGFRIEYRSKSFVNHSF